VGFMPIIAGIKIHWIRTILARFFSLLSYFLSDSTHLKKSKSAKE
jgi:hypothetical protein